MTTFTIDGIAVPITDWQCDQVVDWGDRSLTGKLPDVRYAEEGAPIVAWRGSDDAMWSGHITAAPQKEGDLWSIRAAGNAEILDEQRTRMFYRIDGGEQWQEADGDPHDYVFSGVEKFDLNSKRNMLTWKLGDGTTQYQLNNRAGYVIWVEGAVISGYEFLAEVTGNFNDMDLQMLSGLGPVGTLTVEHTHALTLGAGGTATFTDKQLLGDNPDMLVLRTNVTTAFTPVNRQRVKATQLKVYGRTTDDAFSASDVVTDVAQSAGMATDHVQFNSLGVLPLDWLEDHPDLLTYIAELTDWRWLALHDGVHFGPYERVWDVFSTGDATSNLQPEPRFNRVHVPFRALSGAARVAVGIPEVDPFPGREKVLEVEELEDPQPNSSMADIVAAQRVAYESSARLTGSLDLARVRRYGEVRSPYDLQAGDLINMPDLAIGPQRVTGVTYRPGGVTADIGTGFNVVRSLAEAQRLRRPRVRKRKRRKK